MPNLEGMPYEEEIAWGQWWSGYGDITLKCRNLNTVEIPESRELSWNRKQYQDDTVIDIFVRNNSGAYPLELYQMTNFIQKVIAEQKSLPGDNIDSMFIKSIREVNDPSDESFEDNSLFHIQIIVDIKYWR